MSRYIPSEAAFKNSSEIDLYVIQTFGKIVAPERILQSWFSIANLYFKIGNYSQSEKYLLELLRIQPHNQEANELLGTVYENQGRLKLALEFYERALCNKNASHNHAFVAAELCLKLIKKQKDEAEIKKLTDKALYLIERTRLTNKKYIPRAVHLMNQIYSILVRHAERQSDKRGCLKYRKGNAPASIKWIDNSVKELITVEDTFIDPGFNIILTKAILKLPDYQRAWENIIQRRYNFVDNFDWNLFVKNTFPKLRSCVISDNSKELLHELTEMIFFACDNVVRLSLKFKSREEAGKLVKEFSELITNWEIPSSQNRHLLEKWTRYQQEYQSRSLRHEGFFRLNLASTDLTHYQSAGSKLAEKNQEHLNNAYLNFKACLSFRRETFRDPTCPISHFIYLMCQRISDVSHQLLILLQCFDYEWINRSDMALQILKTDTQDDDDVKQKFCLPTHKNLLGDLSQSVGKENFEEFDLIKWLAKTIHKVDRIALCAPYDLDRFLMVSAWHVENGVLRDWLRDIFPRLQDILKIQESEIIDESAPFQDIYSFFTKVPSYEQLETNLTQLLPRQKIISKIEVPTLMDIEFFLLILLIQRHYHCVIERKAETIGQILYLSTHGCWKPRESHRKFWRTLLSLYGKNFQDKRVYTNDVMSDEEFTQCLREIRGDINIQDYDYHKEQIQTVVNWQGDLFLVMAFFYENMLTRHKQFRSTEGLRCIEIYQNWNRNISKEMPSGHLPKAGKSKIFSVLDDDIIDPGYRRFIPADANINDLTEQFSLAFKERDDSIEQITQQWDTLEECESFLGEHSSVTMLPKKNQKNSNYVTVNNENHSITINPLNEDRVTELDESEDEDKISELDESEDEDKISELDESEEEDKISELDESEEEEEEEDEISELDESEDEDEISELDESIDDDRMSELEKSLLSSEEFDEDFFTPSVTASKINDEIQENNDKDSPNDITDIQDRIDNLNFNDDTNKDDVNDIDLSRDEDLIRVDQEIQEIEPQQDYENIPNISGDQQLNEVISGDQQLGEDISRGQQLDEDISRGQQLDEDISRGQQLDEDISRGQQLDEDISSERQLGEDISSEQQLYEDISSDQQLDEDISSDQQLDEDISGDQQLDEEWDVSIIEKAEKDDDILNENIEEQINSNDK
ncbi:hypothetical protein Glove_627g26 [Diversispora epigaea]|uniref:Uncharacterized protein n=1 Tax=Diversispora epigaea TaxID=1348612 RepID=A0A397G5G7_9GLOM|nr:hypothetical protein Glove_627g26 [Diversispora epigaea]